MSQENVEIVRRLYAAYSRRDSEAPFEHYASDIEWDLSRVWSPLGIGVAHGHDGVRQTFRELLEAFREFDFEVVEMTDANESVLVTVHDHGVGRTSGAVIDHDHYALWTLREGKVVRMCMYADRSEALEAVGLSE